MYLKIFMIGFKLLEVRKQIGRKLDTDFHKG